MVTLFRAARLAYLPWPCSDPLLSDAQLSRHNWTHYPSCPFQVGRYLCFLSSWSPSAVFNSHCVFCRFLVCQLKAVISFGSGGCCLSIFHFPVQGSSCANYWCSYTVSGKNIVSFCLFFFLPQKVFFFKWGSILSDLKRPQYCVLKRCSIAGYVACDRWLFCFRAHPTCVFIWEWGICVECSYFGFAVHNENCNAVTRVYCYQQVPGPANVLHRFHVLLQPILKPHVDVTHWRS